MTELKDKSQRLFTTNFFYDTFSRLCCILWILSNMVLKLINMTLSRSNMWKLIIITTINMLLWNFEGENILGFNVELELLFYIAIILVPLRKHICEGEWNGIGCCTYEAPAANIFIITWRISDNMKLEPKVNGFKLLTSERKLNFQ